MPGARTRVRPAFPHVPSAGTANAAGLIHKPGVWPAGGISETPGARFGRCGEVELPSGSEAALRDTVTVRGRPVRAVPIPLRSQPPIIFPPRTKRQLVSRARGKGVPDILIAAGALATPAADVLRIDRLAAASACVIDGMRPQIVCPQQPPGIELPL